jgi:hypothetical protein
VGDGKMVSNGFQEKEAHCHHATKPPCIFFLVEPKPWLDGETHNKKGPLLGIPHSRPSIAVWLYFFLRNHILAWDKNRERL